MTGVVDDGLKGVPPGTPAFPFEALGSRGWHALRDLMPPFALLKRSALDANRAFLKRLLHATGALYAPHGKTTMSPELFRLQLEDGAWGITLATAGQVAQARRFGVARVLLANEVADRHGLCFLADELRRDTGFELVAYVDSVDGVRLWQEALREAPRPLPVLLEVGFAGGRAGCRDVDAALAVARMVQRAPALRLVGVAGFEGLLHRESAAEEAAAVAAFVAQIGATARALDAARLFASGEILLSAGGSAFYDLVAAGLDGARFSQPHRVVLRSGCALVHDDGTYARAFARVAERWPAVRSLGPPPRAALEVWAAVLSRPEPARVVAGLGKRDASHDGELPRPLAWFRPGEHAAPAALAWPLATAALNDQHALLDTGADTPLRPGDLVGFGISHPCLTFDRWRAFFVVDDAYRVVGGARTFF
ncbi:MAG TPA: alanine racemase [Vicinamibacteria bacterium]|nr:alanine racemase [Vicinamibacteria bacterium]